MTVSYALSAEVKVQAGSLPAQSNTSVSSSAAITEVNMLRKDSSGNNSAITGSNAKCLPGEQIDLPVNGADPGTTYSWSITGNYFKNFTPSTPSVYEGASAVVENGAICTYRYIKGDSFSGSAKKVSCDIFVGGQTVSIEEDTKVFQPDSALITRYGDTYVDNRTIELNRSQFDGGKFHGVDWRGTFVNGPTYGPSLYGSGWYCIVQVGSASRT